MSEPLHPRHKALAELEVHIAQAEATRAGYLAELGTHPSARYAKIMLGQVEQRLAQLRRSRETLLGSAR